MALAALLSAQAWAQAPGASLVPADGGASATRHFDPLGKPPSSFTLELRNGQKAELPFADKRDFDEAKRGFIAEPPYTRIMADAGHVGAGKAKFEGNREGFDRLRSILVPFTPDFEILPGTAPEQRSEPPKPFEVRDPVDPRLSD